MNNLFRAAALSTALGAVACAPNGQIDQRVINSGLTGAGIGALFGAGAGALGAVMSPQPYYGGGGPYPGQAGYGATPYYRAGQPVPQTPRGYGYIDDYGYPRNVCTNRYGGNPRPC